MDNVVYLFGSGASSAELSRQGMDPDVSMRGIGDAVLELSRQRGGKYSELQQRLSIPPHQDIERVISLLEGFGSSQPELEEIGIELRQLFREYLISQITAEDLSPRLHGALLHIHHYYGAVMGQNGENLVGLLTTNYDSLLDKACTTVHGSIDYGHKYQSVDYKNSTSAVPSLLKLHGSFNWRIDNNDETLHVAKRFEELGEHDDLSGWIPPSVYKRPSGGVFGAIWKSAAKILTNCDILRVVGSSLRNEDSSLLSLIFTSQVNSTKSINIELIIPPDEARGIDPQEGIINRLSFLGSMKPIDDTSAYDPGLVQNDNIFYSWLLMKLKEAEVNYGEQIEDQYIADSLQ